MYLYNVYMFLYTHTHLLLYGECECELCALYPEEETKIQRMSWYNQVICKWQKEKKDPWIQVL